MEHLVASASSDLVVLMEKSLYLTKNSLGNLVRKMEEDKGLASASLMVRCLTERGYATARVMDSLYGYRSRAGALPDSLMGNKIWRRSALFSGLMEPCGKMRGGALLTPLSEEALSRRTSRRAVLPKAAVHRFTDAAIAGAKKRFSREDVDRVLKLVKKDSSKLTSG